VLREDFARSTEQGRGESGSAGNPSSIFQME
jgi:hypothetical protein